MQYEIETCLLAMSLYMLIIRVGRKISHGQNVFHLTLPEQMCPFKFFLKLVLRPHHHLRPLHSLWKKAKIGNLNFVFAMVKMHPQ